MSLLRFIRLLCRHPVVVELAAASDSPDIGWVMRVMSGRCVIVFMRDRRRPHAKPMTAKTVTAKATETDILIEPNILRVLKCAENFLLGMCLSHLLQSAPIRQPILRS